MKRTAVLVVTGLLAASCSTAAPPIPNPGGLSNEALTVQYVIERGCLPYLLGEKSEEAAMRSARLRYFRPPRIPVLSAVLQMSPDPPYWTTGLPLDLRVFVGRGVCNFVVRGSAAAAYRTAADLALLHKLGPGTDGDGCSAGPVVLAGQTTGCRRSIRYSYYPVPRANRFEIELRSSER